MDRFEIVGSKHWKNKVTNATASIYGAVPYTSEADRGNWEVIKRGYTLRDNDKGIVGNGARQPFADYQDAVKYLAKINKLYNIKA